MTKTLSRRPRGIDATLGGVAMTILFIRRSPAAHHETWGLRPEDSNDAETLGCGA